MAYSEAIKKFNYETCCTIYDSMLSFLKMEGTKLYPGYH